MSRTHEFHVRLCMERDSHKKAWEILQRMDHEEYHSYSDMVASALMAMDSLGGNSERPIVPVSDEMRQYAEQIVAFVESILKHTIPSFLSGLSTPVENVRLDVNQQPSSNSEEKEEIPQDVIPDEEIDWGFLGEL